VGLKNRKPGITIALGPREIPLVEIRATKVFPVIRVTIPNGRQNGFFSSKECAAWPLRDLVEIKTKKPDGLGSRAVAPSRQSSNLGV